jgi:hypothetical protein
VDAAAIAADRERSARTRWRRSVVVRLLPEPMQLELHVARPLVARVNRDDMQIVSGRNRP